MYSLPQMKQEARALREVRDYVESRGVHVAEVRNDGAVPPEFTQGKSDQIDWSPSAAAADTLARVYLRERERLEGVRVADTQHFNRYMETLQNNLVKLRDTFKNSIDNSKDASANFFKYRVWSFEHKDSKWGPTIHLEILDPESGEVVASAPYTRHPIPDWTNSGEIQTTLGNIANWLESSVDERGGMAPLPLIEAQLVIRTLTHGDDSDWRGLIDIEQELAERYDRGVIDATQSNPPDEDLRSALLMQSLSEKRDSAELRFHNAIEQESFSTTDLQYFRDVHTRIYTAERNAEKEAENAKEVLNMVRERVPDNYMITIDPRNDRGIVISDESGTERAVISLVEEPRKVKVVLDKIEGSR